MPVPFTTLCKSITDDGCTIRCRTIGSSMFPLIRSGNIIEIKPVSINEIRSNDIIAFRSGDYVIAHRVKKILCKDKKTVFFAKGDSHFGPARQKVSFEQILGKVVSLQFSAGRIINISYWPTRQLMLATSFFSPFVYSILSTLGKMKKMLRGHFLLFSLLFAIFNYQFH